MKKLFISVPMKGRTEEQIKASVEKMHKIAEATVGEPLEVIDSYIEVNPPKDSKEAVWYLGESIKKLSQADYMISIPPYPMYHGCVIEDMVAHHYGIPRISAPTKYVAPDVHEKG